MIHGSPINFHQIANKPKKRRLERNQGRQPDDCENHPQPTFLTFPPRSTSRSISQLKQTAATLVVGLSSSSKPTVGEQQRREASSQTSKKNQTTTAKAQRAQAKPRGGLGYRTTTETAMFDDVTTRSNIKAACRWFAKMRTCTSSRSSVCASRWHVSSWFESSWHVPRSHHASDAELVGCLCFPDQGRPEDGFSYPPSPYLHLALCLIFFAPISVCFQTRRPRWPH